jgi:hypothetical protein
MMELPIVAPAPVVTDHAAVFLDLFDSTLANQAANNTL